MATLTRPFINSINAFDATKGSGSNIVLSVLGGGIINSYTYTIYDNDTNNVVVQNTNIVVSDIDTTAIRTFTIDILANVLSNNKQYYIVAYTNNNNGDKSPTSGQAIFDCYLTPKFGVGYNYNDLDEYNLLIDGTKITAEKIYIKPTFYKIDTISPATLNQYRVKVIGHIGTTSTTIYDSGIIYDVAKAIIVDGFTPTVGSSAKYERYTLSIIGTTVEGMEFSQVDIQPESGLSPILVKEISNISCEYTIGTISDSFTAKNKCGYIQIQSTADDFRGSKIVIQRQEENSSIWVDIATIENTNGRFIINDYFNRNNVFYTYRFVPYDLQNNIGTPQTASVVSKFNGSYICDSNHIYDITSQWTIGSKSLQQKSAIYEPIGSEMPFVAYNAKTKYYSGSYTAVLLADTSNQETTSYLDRNAQSALVDEFNNWLVNKQEKVIKDFNGNARYIAITDAISNEYYQELGNGLASTTFNFVEIKKLDYGETPSTGYEQTNVYETYNGDYTITESGTYNTNGKLMLGDIIVDTGGKPQDKTVYPSQVKQEITYDEGYTSLRNVTVEPALLQNKTITENGTITPDEGYYGLGQVIVNTPVVTDVPQLRTPTLSRSNDTMTISNPSTNGNFVQKYRIYNKGEALKEQTSTSFSLVGLGAGEYELQVRAVSAGFYDSEASNTVKAKVYNVALALTNLTSTNTTAFISNNLPWTTTIKPVTNYYLPEDIVVTMSGKSCTYEYDSYTGALSVPNASGDISITAVAYTTNKLHRPTISISGTSLTVTPPRFATITNTYINDSIAWVFEPLYVVEDVSGATYGFALNSNNYYVSQNKGKASSYAICKVTFKTSAEKTITLRCINSGEANYDYGIISQVDQTLSLDNNDDGATGSTKVLKNFKGASSTTPVDLSITIPSGTHYIYCKFRKDGSGDQNNDSLQFMVVE